MAYEKQKFIDKVTVLSAKQLDHMEDGIYKNSLAADTIRNMGWIPNKGSESVVLMEETTLTGGITDAINYDALVGKEEVAVLFDGKLYICVPEFAYESGDGFYVRLGNKSITNSNNVNTGEPFFFLGYKGTSFLLVTFAESGSHTVSITSFGYNYDKMPAEYFPESLPEIVFEDIATGIKYKLYVYNGKLSMEVV